MTKEELEKEAKQSYFDNTYEMQWDAECDFEYTRGYLASAEPREKRIAELETQIEKMKCCENCHHWEDREPIPSSAEEGYFCYNDHNGICKRWELAKEDDYYRR